LIQEISEQSIVAVLGIQIRHFPALAGDEVFPTSPVTVAYRRDGGVESRGSFSPAGDGGSHAFSLDVEEFGIARGSNDEWVR
jgi:hypothetical protein